MALSSDPRLPQIDLQGGGEYVTVAFWRRFQERFYQLWRETVTEIDKLDGPSQGADVASATGLILGTGSSLIHITGTTQIDRLDNRTFRGGQRITFIFDASVNVRHNQAASGTERSFQLAGAATFAATAGDTLTVVYDSVNDNFREVGRAVI